MGAGHQRTVFSLSTPALDLARIKPFGKGDVMTYFELLHQVVSALHQLPNQDIRCAFAQSCFIKSYGLAAYINGLLKGLDEGLPNSELGAMLPSNIKTTCTMYTQCYGAHRCTCPAQQTLGKPHPLAMARTNLNAYDDKPIKPEVITL